MVNTQLLDYLPLWGIFIFAVVLMLLSDEVGFRLGDYLERNHPERAEGSLTAMVGASLAFLGFLLALITSTAVGISSERRNLVVTEANAIGTTYLRAEYLDEPISSQSRRLLREYVDVRLAALEPGGLEAALARSEEIHRQLWSLAVDLARSAPTPVTSLYISSLNDVIDIHTLRVRAGLYVRIPPAILLVLYGVAFLSMMLIGMQSSYTRKRNTIALFMMVVILAMAFTLISDLERGQSGMIQTSPQTLIDLQQQMRLDPQ